MDRLLHEKSAATHVQACFLCKRAHCTFFALSRVAFASDRGASAETSVISRAFYESSEFWGRKGRLKGEPARGTDSGLAAASQPDIGTSTKI